MLTKFLMVFFFFFLSYEVPVRDRDSKEACVEEPATDSKSNTQQQSEESDSKNRANQQKLDLAESVSAGNAQFKERVNLDRKQASLVSKLKTQQKLNSSEDAYSQERIPKGFTSTFAFTLNHPKTVSPNNLIDSSDGLRKSVLTSLDTRPAMGSGASKEENSLVGGDGGDNSRQVQSQAAMSDAPGSRSQASFSGRPIRSHMSQQGKMSAIAESSRSRTSRVGRLSLNSCFFMLKIPCNKSLGMASFFTFQIHLVVISSKDL